jgi:hypothetical protein
MMSHRLHARCLRNTLDLPFCEEYIFSLRKAVEEEVDFLFLVRLKKERKGDRETPRGEFIQKVEGKGEPSV